ncbi:hypothetical protein ABEB36_000623 [Hypothenemus hampei]|uniref:Uncharacterized protein n=1 Tax=Hypothenemus hampei TaxID=57062 RepID=A0ABD1FBV8_HYPHA
MQVTKTSFRNNIENELKIQTFGFISLGVKGCCTKTPLEIPPATLYAMFYIQLISKQFPATFTRIEIYDPRGYPATPACNWSVGNLKGPAIQT